jgi:hypothetical protein
VNAVGNAVRILQILLVDMGFEVVVDGALYPQFVASVQAVFETAGGYLIDAYGIARRNYYLRPTDRRPASHKYARARAGKKGGRSRRAEEFITPRYHLSQLQFNKRVAS